MNKAKQMQNKLVKQAALVGGIAVFCIGAMVFTASLASDALQKKNAAEGTRNNQAAQISTIRSQIDQSGDAEKRFVDIALQHRSGDYSANTDTLKTWLRDMKEQYRFSDTFKLTLAVDKPSDKPEFANLNYTVTVRAPMKLEFAAISDMHAFSFLDQIEHDMLGMVRITKFEIARKSDMNAKTFSDLALGSAPTDTDVTIEFTWVGIEPKTQKTDANAAAPSGVQP